METWLSLGEIARALKIPTKSIYEYARRGDGPKTYKYGKHLRVQFEDYQTWKSEHLEK
jgi:predicted DNA-binding protein YlxM (UPF0122 family)